MKPRYSDTFLQILISSFKWGTFKILLFETLKKRGNIFSEEGWSAL